MKGIVDAVATSRRPLQGKNVAYAEDEES